MFREMREVGEKLTEKEAVEMLEKLPHGVLALEGDESHPYAVPISFAYEDGKIYFHSSKNGHKTDSIKNNGKVSFCVIDQDQIIPDQFNTLYRSAIVFGTARILIDKEEKLHAMECIINKYSKGYEKEGRAYADSVWDDFVAVEITIEHLTGKAGN